ncbi:GM10980 [Drosophila sechellia]|uniref:GM10980 n=1 Tax=Drosophila sechellia TaxID=7238 RepID=B4I4Y0_DROSE|nr:GM10980 [Drosophila sechellia]
MTRGSCILSLVLAYCAFPAEQNGQRRWSLLFYTDVSRFYGSFFFASGNPPFWNSENRHATPRTGKQRTSPGKQIGFHR